MINDCGLLTGDPGRYAIRGTFDPTPELAAFMSTPGFLPEHYRLFWGWAHKQLVYVRETRPVWFDRVGGIETAKSITTEDALLLLVELRYMAGPLRVVPYWCGLALREAGVQGVVDKLVRRGVRVPDREIARWRIAWRNPAWGLGGVWRSKSWTRWRLDW